MVNDVLNVSGTFLPMLEVFKLFLLSSGDEFLV